MWNKTVMVVDPSGATLQSIGTALSEAEIQPVLVNSMREALRVNLAGYIDVITLDMQLTCADGTPALDAFRKLAPEMPLLAMCKTAGGEANHLLRKARYSGVDAVLEKPFQPKMMVSIVDQIEQLSLRNRTSVLIIDDSRTIVQAVARMLPADRYSVSIALSAEEALARPDIVGVDVIVTDIFMPGVGGIAAIAEVREKWPSIGIIAMSAGYGDEMDKSKALDAAQKMGAQATIKKPFRAETLCEMVDKVALEQKRAFLAAYGDDDFAIAG